MKLILQGVLCATIILALPSPETRAQEPVTIAGYPLHRPFTMKACPTNKSGFPEFTADQPCWTPEYPHDEVTRKIWWPSGKIPLGYQMWADVRDGVLTRVEFGTGGAQDQDKVLGQLRAKFGTPASFSLEPMQNAFGMKFDGYLAVWDTAQVHVEFHDITNQSDRGSVVIETPAEHARFLRSLQAHQPSKL